MSEPTHSATITIVNPQGLHMRPAYLFAEAASRFSSSVQLIKDDMRIDGKSVLSILTLGAVQGSQLQLEVNGPDADDALRSLVELVQSGFSGAYEDNGQAEGEATADGPNHLNQQGQSP